MKKLFLCAIAVSILLSGCGNKKPDLKSLDYSQKEESSVTLTMTAPSGELYDIDRKLLKKYEEYSGNKIELQEIPDDQYTNVLKARLASGAGPDMAVIWPQVNASQFIPERFYDLSEQEWLSGETEEAVANQSYDGNVIGFGLEGGNSGWGVVYNKEIFDNCGISIPENTEEFWKDCEILKENGYTPLAGAFKEEWTLGIWMALMGSKASEEIQNYYGKLNCNELGFADSNVYLKFIEDFKETYEKGYFGQLALSSTARDAFLQVFDGTAAMALSNCTPEVWLADSKITIETQKYGMFPAPFADNTYITVYKGGFIRVINKKSKYIEECLDYFNFLAKPGNLEVYYSAPERRTVNPAFCAYESVDNISVFEKDLVNNSDGGVELIGETGIRYWDNTTFGHYVLQAVLGIETPQEALKNIDEYRKKQFDAEG